MRPGRFNLLRDNHDNQPLGDGLFGLKLSASIAAWSFDSPVRRRTTSAGIGLYINFTAASGY
jgi:hypothetical protein